VVTQKHIIMKTLLTFGTWTLDKKGGLIYNVIIYGQTAENPKITFITEISISCMGYDYFVKKAKEIYCNYFGCDDYNIITLSHIDRI
jgi:hypothetical protein